VIGLRVWLRTWEGEACLAGAIRVADPDPRRGGLLRGEFRYEGAYLDSPNAFALDPIHLPLESRVFDSARPQAGVHACFEDSLPDDWGRGLLIRRAGVARDLQTPPHLLTVLGGDGLGALAYTTRPDAPPESEVLQATADLEDLIDAALVYDQDPGAMGEGDLRRLFQAASSPGGARPKLVIRHQGRGWIAKLASSRDQVDMVRVEAACLALAEGAGLVVPAFQVATFGRRAALLVERFDTTPAGGRDHVLSLRTLVGAEGFYHLGYGDLADCLRRVSACPEDDMPDLYRQMAFNAVLGNTDDHLKNFALRRLPEGWRLTPAYDLLPDVAARGEHCLHFGAVGTRPSPAAVRDLGRAFGLSRQRVARITDRVLESVSRWRARFGDLGVTQADWARLARDLDRRLASWA